ncbi:TPM domain-containing protein [Streptomyces sp. NPDC048577]|uniref:TPM domain-containing protein n=1 Tax=Streptomyces sp. NPDC048577 TaxID=3157209 RepID=UPI003444C7DA
MLVATWWPAVPAAHGARADDRAAVSREGGITDRVGALEDRRAPVGYAPDRLYDGPGAAADGGASATDLVLPVVLIGGAGTVAAYAYARRRRSGTRRVPPTGGRAWGPPKTPEAKPPAELDGLARGALVATDDAVHTSQEELGFAEARFGGEAVERFTKAVAFAESELTAAFRLRRRLDDGFPGDDATRRSLLAEIVTRCGQANARLDAESADFDRLRALEAEAGEALEAATAACREQTGRAATAEATLAAMRERYAESAVSAVAADVEQAKDRLAFAGTRLDLARQAVGSGDNGAAAVHIRAAEGGIDQAARLGRAVDRRARELAEAVGSLPHALTGTEADLVEARGLLRGAGGGMVAAGLQGRAARAESVLAEVRRTVEAGRYDPLDALRRIEEAGTGLDEVLEGARDRASLTHRARMLLDRSMLTARSATGAAVDYVTTHRGAVGSEARTRLAEARRRLEEARLLADGDPRGALDEARQADTLARQAQNLAEQDVRAYGNPYRPAGSAGAGGGNGGAVLGGIILGGGARGTGGGSGDFGGGAGSGPGSFGGGDTRGRLGGGGRP